MDRNKTKLAVTTALILFTLVSLIVAYIMSKNLGTDVSKTRFRLTKDYKALKDTELKYDPATGHKVYKALCSKCHGKDGRGSSAPPLVGSPLVTGPQTQLIKIVLYGVKGKVERAGRTYNSVMPGFKKIPHNELAQVLSYVKEEFGKNSERVNEVEVVKGKIDYIEQIGPFNINDL